MSIIRNRVKAASGIAVGASAVDSDVSNSIELLDPLQVLMKVRLAAVAQTTGIAFKLKDSFDGGTTWFDVGDQSAVSVIKKTFAGSVAEISDIAWPAYSAAANGDYLHATAYDGTTYAAYLNKRIVEVQTLTFPAKATAANGDYIVVYTAAGVSYAVALTKPIAEVQTLTFPAFASVTDRDYIVVYNQAGTSYAVYADKTGTSIAPTGAAYVAATYKVKADISADTTAAAVAARFETAFNTLTGFTAAITTDDTAADGTMLLTQAVKGPAINPDPHNLGDTDVGTLAGVQTTAGIAAQTPTGAAWVAATYTGLADLSSDTTAAHVAARAETALNLLTGFTTAITSDDTAADGTMLLTQVLSGPTTNPVPKDFDDAGVGTILGVQTTAGVTTNTVPSGVLYTAAAQKIAINIEPSGTAAQTAAAARAALVANAAWAADFTTSAITTATFTITQVGGGVVADPAPKREDDGAAGSVTVSVTTPGSDGSAVVTGTERITISTHGFLTGDPVIYGAGSLAVGGLTAGITYYVIKIDANTLKLATTQALALAGTAVDITTLGTGTQALYAADYEIRMTYLDATDLAQLPVWNTLKVVANTGASDSCTVSAIYVQD